MDNYAPVLISVLDRDVHFKNCIQSLEKNSLAKKTHLFIALDAPFNEKHIRGYNKILSFFDSIKGFKDVTIFQRETNMGSSANQFLAMSDIFNQYDRLIFTEDDNIFSPCFLEYVNKGLKKFEKDDSIFSICGYNYPIKIPNKYQYNYYTWKGWCAWGAGIWRDKWYKIKFGIEYVKLGLSEIANIKKLNKYAEIYYPGCKRMIETGHITDDGLICLYIILNNLYSVFPVVSKVKNFGQDGSGEHCSKLKNDIYSTQRIDISDTFDYIDNNEKENKIIYKLLKKHFKLSFKSRLRMIFNDYNLSLQNNIHQFDLISYK